MLPLELAKFLRFALVGVVNTCTDLGIFGLLVRILEKINLPKIKKYHVVIAHITSFLCANLVGFILNSKFTFNDSSKSANWFTYLIVSLFSLAISTSLIHVFSKPNFFESFKSKLNTIIPNPKIQKMDIKTWY
jgi:putative flippase GtrA